MRICGWLIGIEIDAYGSMGMGLDACGEDRCLREREREREREFDNERRANKKIERSFEKEIELKGNKVERKGRRLRWNVRDNRDKDKIKRGEK